MTDCLSEGHYTVLTLQHLLIDNNNKNLHTLLQLTTAMQLFMMSCDKNELLNVENKQVFEFLFNFLQKNHSVKIILNTQSENVTLTLLQDVAKEALSNGIVTRDEQLTQSDLITEKLLEIAVNLEGSDISLNYFVSAGSPV